MNDTTSVPVAKFSPRVSPELGPALGGVMRLTWGQQWVFRNIMWAIAVTGALGFVGFMIGYGEEPQGFIEWVDRIILMLGVPVIAFDAGARAIREDLKPGAVDYIITRPVPRWAYALFKFISSWVVVMLLASFGLVVMLNVGWLLGVQVDSYLRYFGVMTAGVSAFLALGFFLGSLTSRYLLLGLLYAGLIEAAVGSIPIQLNKLSILRHLWRALEMPLAHGGKIGTTLGFVMLITLGLLAAAIVIFARKEFIGKKSDDA